MDNNDKQQTQNVPQLSRRNRQLKQEIEHIKKAARD